MTDPRLTIRQMCDRHGVTPRTLRFYEAKELLFPDRIGQKRLFTKRDNARMKLILRGKRYGFSLEEIRQLLDLYSINDGQRRQITKSLEIAGRRLLDMENTRRELNKSIADLKSRIHDGEVYLAEISHKNAAA